MRRFSDDANTHYRYPNIDFLVNNKDELSKIISHHQNEQQPRLKELRDYYKGNNAGILGGKRRKEDHMADNRATHNFAQYVSQFIQGYMVGVPLKTTYPDESIEKKIRELNRTNDADEHNSDLVLEQSVFGRAYELLYRGNDDTTRFVALDPLHTFVVYDDTVERNPICAVRYLGRQYKDEIDVFLYTEDKIMEYELKDDYLTLKHEADHYFKGVPIIEYESEKYRMGDFEGVLNLIDLYDSSQSDTANYTQDLNDAMLVITGNLDIDIDQAQKQKMYNLLFLQTEPNADGKEGKADAKYIYKQYDVAGSEAYKDRVFNNILLFTSIPNLLDDKAGTRSQSGEALKMKLFALEQKRAIKERLFKKSLRDRYRLIGNISDVASEGSFDVNEITITFTENLPSMIAKEMEWFNSSGGQLSQKTMLSQLSFVDNPDEEMEQIETEDKLYEAREQAFESPVTEEADTDGEE